MAGGDSVFGYTNYFKTGTLTANSAVAGLGASNLSSDQCTPATGWQTLNGVMTSTPGGSNDAQMRCTALTPGSTWRAVALVRTNLRTSATVRFQFFSGVTNVSDTTIAGPKVGYGQVVLVLPANVTADYVQILVNDSGNPDNHINIGGAFAGPAWIPSVGISWDFAQGSVANQLKATTRGGQDYQDPLARQRIAKLRLDGVTAADAWAQLGELDRTAMMGRNILFIPDRLSPDIYYEAIFGALDSDVMSFANRFFDARSWAAAISERL